MKKCSLLILTIAGMAMVIASCGSGSKDVPKPPTTGGGTPPPTVKTPNFVVASSATAWYLSSGTATATAVADVDSLWSNYGGSFVNGVLTINFSSLFQPQTEIKFYAKNKTGGYAENSAFLSAYSQFRTGFCQIGRFTMATYTQQVIGFPTIDSHSINKDTTQFKANDSTYTTKYGGTGFKYGGTYKLNNEWASNNVEQIWGDTCIIDWINETGFQRHFDKPALNPLYTVRHTQVFKRVDR